ncbi:MAG: hypothetical protein U1F25_13620 [Rubrivivax sp.]
MGQFELVGDAPFVEYSAAGLPRRLAARVLAGDPVRTMNAAALALLARIEAGEGRSRWCAWWS